MTFKRPLAHLVLSMLATVLNSMEAQKQVSIPEQTKWTWMVQPDHPDPKLPNILLLGDSITRNYSLQVGKDLAGVANVCLLALSTSLGDPRLPRQIMDFAALEGVPFSVVHFNNGMHGWSYSEDQYRRSFPRFLRAVEKVKASCGSLIWASITPVQLDASRAILYRV